MRDQSRRLSGNGGLRQFKANVVTTHCYTHGTKGVGGRDKGGHGVGGYGQTFFGFLPIENVFGSSETNS